VQGKLTKLCERLSNELPHLKGKVELLGISSLEASSVRFRISVVTESMKQAIVQRLILREVKIELDKNNIEIPYTQMVIHNG
jgi:small conductance mechanosensitive channel